MGVGRLFAPLLAGLRRLLAPPPAKKPARKTARRPARKPARKPAGESTPPRSATRKSPASPRRSPARTPARTPARNRLPAEKVVRLINEWGSLAATAPDQDRSAAYLAASSGVSRREIDHARRVRNRCAHPGEHEPPPEAEVDRALATLRKVRAGLGRRSQGTSSGSRARPAR